MKKFNRQIKIESLFFCVLLLFFFRPSIETERKDKALSSDFVMPLGINFRELCWTDTRNNTRIAVVKFITSQISVGAVALTEPIVRLTIWDCKTSGFSWTYKAWRKDLGLRECWWSGSGAMDF